ncbi:MAG: hypothetical protein ACRERX_16725 [Pseudomonas sp.]
MSARSNKKRVSRLFYSRFHGLFRWMSAGEQAWEYAAPVGREFGSPDYDRLTRQDLENQTGVFDPAYKKKKGRSVLKLAGMFKSEKHVEIEDMRIKPGDNYRDQTLER